MGGRRRVWWSRSRHWRRVVSHDCGRDSHVLLPWGAGGRRLEAVRRDREEYRESDSGGRRRGAQQGVAERRGDGGGRGDGGEAVAARGVAGGVRLRASPGERAFREARVV